jgi:5-formyltetrahydrofolate cyclo-ligase
MEGAELKAWRRSQRERLIALRQALPAAERRDWGNRIEAELRALLAERPGILGVYWPFRAEFDPRPLIDWAVAGGRTVALPVVIDKKGPLEYRTWRPGEPLADGVWNIPVPEKREVVTPTMVLAPLVGFDEACYRLGYGGGYFDRTLGAMAPRALAIGIGFEAQRLETIYPQSFDVPMALIVTEAGIRKRSAGP